MHMTKREIIPGRKKLESVLYKLWPLLTSWLAASRCWLIWCELKQTDLAGYWMVQHTERVRAKARQ